jgi:hypothetical protein
MSFRLKPPNEYATNACDDSLTKHSTSDDMEDI